MRILFWTGSFWPNIGGTKVLASKHLPALQTKGFEFLVVTSLDAQNLSLVDEYKGISIHRFPFWDCMEEPEKLFEIRQEISDLKRSFAPDLIHLNSVNPSHLYYHLTASVHPVPVLVTLHSLMNPPTHELMRKTLLHADWVVGCSKYIIKESQRMVPEIRSHSSVLYNGLEAPAFPPAPLSFDPPRLLCLGRLVPEKGFDVALSAFHAIRARFPQARLTLAGDGPARPDLEAKAKELGLWGSIDFVGWVHPEQVPELVSASTVVIMPSRGQEAFGLVALDAALMARPIVATRVGGIPEIVLHQQTGLLVENEDSAAISKAVVYLLDHPEKARQMGQEGRTWALKAFGWERYVSEYDALYRSLIANEIKKTGFLPWNHQMKAL